MIALTRFLGSILSQDTPLSLLVMGQIDRSAIFDKIKKVSWRGRKSIHALFKCV